MVEYFKLLPILLVTLSMVIIAFAPQSVIKKKNKKMANLIAFILWLSVVGITYVSLFLN